MSAPITEVVVLTVQAHINSEGPLKGVSDILHRQPGFRRFNWSPWNESQEKIQLFIDWDNLRAHQDFEKSGADYASVGALLAPILAAAPSPHHVSFSPLISSTLLNNNVTELATFYGLSSSFTFNLGLFLNVLRQATGFEGVSGGTIVEDLEFKETKGKVYMLAISWKSVEDHVKAMTREDVMECLPLIGEAAEHVEMHHVKFREE